MIDIVTQSEDSELLLEILAMKTHDFLESQ